MAPPRGGGTPPVKIAALALGLLVWAPMAWAGKAHVLFVEATQEAGDVWTFSVTVSHEDRDPTHWADEQSFTRDERIRIPPNVRIVVVEAHDRVHGLGGATVTVDLAKPAGQGYTVMRRP